jgi:hypothetical protein
MSTCFGTKLFAVISKLSSLEYTALRMPGMRGVIRGCARLRMAASELLMSRKALRYDIRVGRCSSEVFVMCSIIVATTHSSAHSKMPNVLSQSSVWSWECRT